MSVVYGWEPLAAALDDGIEALVQRHWQEIALDRDTVPLDVDWERKFSLEAEGVWRGFAARRDGRLIGYVAFFIHEHHHNYRSTRYIYDDIFWLAPEERRGLVGYRLLKESLAALPRPAKVQFRAKIGFENGRVGLLLQRLGLQPVEVVHSAYLA